MRVLGSLFGTFVLMLLSFAVMWFGWGLRPVSWGWVIWGSIGAVVLSGIIMGMTDDK